MLEVDLSTLDTDSSFPQTIISGIYKVKIDVKEISSCEERTSLPCVNADISKDRERLIFKDVSFTDKAVQISLNNEENILCADSMGHKILLFSIEKLD